MDAVIELEIRAGTADGLFEVRVVRALAGGEPAATIALDIDDILDDLSRIESSVLASSVHARRVMTASESAIQEIGVRLFDAVFSGQIGAAYRASAAVAAERNLVPRVALRLITPRLAALPWEALYDSEAGHYVSRKEPLIRRVSAPFAAEAPPVEPPLRVLGLVSSPRGLQVLDVEAEKERLELALHDHLEDGSVELVWLDDVTWGGVQTRLLTERWHVLHFIGHGGFDEQSDEGLIALVGRDGRADFVTATSLADLLNEADPRPRLVVLNSCQSGATGTSDLFAGTAATLVRSGIPAVVAMQFAISDYAALAFSRSFYVALASGRRIDEAVRSGRIGVLGIARDTLEWITPVLYLRGDDTRVLDRAKLPEPRTRTPLPLVTPDSPEPHITPDQRPDADASTPAAAPSPSSAGGSAVRGPEPAGPPAAPPGAVADMGASPSTPPGSHGSGPSPHRRRMGATAVVAVVLVLAGAAWAASALLRPVEATPEESDVVATSPAAPEPTETVFPPVSLAIPGDVDWTATGVSCETGDTLTITAEGLINHAPPADATAPPDGLAEFREFNIPELPDAPHAALIGRLDQQEPFLVGSSAVYTCPENGSLTLGINDAGTGNNSGAFTATITRTEYLD